MEADMFEYQAWDWFEGEGQSGQGKGWYRRVDGGHVFLGAELVSLLNEQGAQGWELVTTHCRQGHDIILKKRLKGVLRI